MKVTIRIDSESAAFEDAPATETARILLDISKRIAFGEIITSESLRDSNGNVVGEITINGQK